MDEIVLKQRKYKSMIHELNRLRITKNKFSIIHVKDKSLYSGNETLNVI